MTDNDSAPSRSPHQDSDADPSRDDAEAHPSSGREDSSGTKTFAGVLRLAGLGTELAGITLAFLAVGYLVDSVRGHDTGYATAFGTFVGFTLGMIRFIREVRKINEN